MPPLYAIAENISRVLESVADDGSFPDGIEAALDSLEIDLAAKVDSICRYMADLNGEAEKFAAESARLSILAKQAKGRHDRLKKYVHGCLAKVGMRRLNTDLFKLSVCKNPRPLIYLAEGTAIPAEYLVTRLSFNSQAAYEDWKAGRTMPPEIVVEHGEHLRIR